MKQASPLYCGCRWLGFLTVLLHLGIASAQASPRVLLIWNRNPEPDIAGYKIHYGTNSGQYVVTVDVGNVTNSIVDNLTAGRTYYFSATAYNTALLESDYATEVSLLLSTSSNAAPAVVVYANITAAKETSTAASTFRVTDADGASDSMTLDMGVTRGTLQMAASVANGVVANQITGNGSKQVRVQSSLAAINNTLNSASGLNYRGDLNLVGADTLTVTITDSGNQGAQPPLSNTRSIGIQVVGDAYDTWVNQLFSASELVNPSLASALYGENANPDGDSFENLMEYALGLDPYIGETADGVLEFSTVVEASATYNSLTFHRRKNQTFLQYRAEVSADAINWLSGVSVTRQTGLVSVSSDFEAVTFQDLTAIQSGSPRFMRLTVQRATP